MSSGAEIIKHQTHIVDDEMSDDAKSVIPGNSDKSIYEIMDRCSLSEDEEKELMDKRLNFGDLSLFHTSIPHGVETIDQNDPSPKRGRLMAIAAVNPFSGVDGFQAKNA